MNHKTLADLLLHRAQENPEHSAYRYLDGDNEVRHDTSHASLLGDAARVAAALQESSSPGDRCGGLI